MFVLTREQEIGVVFHLKLHKCQSLTLGDVLSLRSSHNINTQQLSSEVWDGVGFKMQTVTPLIVVIIQRLRTQTGLYAGY